MYMLQKTDLLERRRRKMLHIAPERQISRLLRRLKHVDYLSADLSDYAMVTMDITDIQYADNSFDIIYCSHVLEHVPQDTVALAELHRVLKPGGWAILQVPIEGYFDLPVIETTLEDPTVTEPQQREQLYGQYDHVRRYGRDYKDRLIAAGFSVNVDAFARDLTPKDRVRFGIVEEDVYLCSKL